MCDVPPSLAPHINFQADQIAGTIINPRNQVEPRAMLVCFFGLSAAGEEDHFKLSPDLV